MISLWSYGNASQLIMIAVFVCVVNEWSVDILPRRLLHYNNLSMLG
jgi:hypothetical protein